MSDEFFTKLNKLNSELVEINKKKENLLSEINKLNSEAEEKVSKIRDMEKERSKYGIIKNEKTKYEVKIEKKLENSSKISEYIERCKEYLGETEIENAENIGENIISKAHEKHLEYLCEGIGLFYHYEICLYYNPSNVKDCAGNDADLNSLRNSDNCCHKRYGEVCTIHVEDILYYPNMYDFTIDWDEIKPEYIVDEYRLN